MWKNGLCYRRTGIILCTADQSYACKEKYGTQYSIYDQGFDLVVGAFRIHENRSTINKTYYAQYGQYDAKCPFYVHNSLLGWLQKNLQPAEKSLQARELIEK